MWLEKDFGCARKFHDFSDEYNLGKEIGKGAYARVRFAEHKVTGQKFAVKIYDKFKLFDSQRRKSVRKEIKLLQKIKHPNIVQFIDAVDTIKNIFLVMECLRGGSLHSYLKRKPGRRLEDSKAKRVFFQVCRGLKYLHNHDVCHRDIKLENLLLDHRGNVK